MVILKSIGLWLLKTFLGGLFNGLANKEAEKARADAGRAQVQAITADEAKNVEVKILEQQTEAARTFKERKLPDDDPFGFKSFNRGE